MAVTQEVGGRAAWLGAMYSALPRKIYIGTPPTCHEHCTARDRAPRRNTCLGFNWISRKRWENVEYAQWGELTKGETSS